MKNKKEREDKNYELIRPERRKDFRNLIITKVRGTGNVFFGYAKTISKNGMFIATARPRKIGEENRVFFTLPGEDWSVECVCRVAWVKDYDPARSREPGMGVEFVNIEDGMEKKISDWVERQEEKNKF